MEPQVGNESILDLLVMYKNEEGKKRDYARGQLMRIYEVQSYIYQHAILREFLSGDITAGDWAARKLQVDWRAPFSEAIARLWASSPSYDLALTVVLHLPEGYVLQHQNELCHYVGYLIICSRLWNVPGFTIGDERLSIVDLFRIMSLRNR